MHVVQRGSLVDMYGCHHKCTDSQRTSSCHLHMRDLNARAGAGHTPNSDVLLGSLAMLVKSRASRRESSDAIATHDLSTFTYSYASRTRLTIVSEFLPDLHHQPNHLVRGRLLLDPATFIATFI
jgi:hypothetical protein